MADKFVTFTVYSFPGQSANGMMLPAAYIESDYVPTAVRIYADKAPDYADATFDILDDGVSIFNAHGTSQLNPKTMGNPETYPNYPEASLDTSIALPQGQNADEMADDFNTNTIDRDSWLTCQIKSDGGGRNFTVILELEKVTEADEADE